MVKTIRAEQERQESGQKKNDDKGKQFDTSLQAESDEQDVTPEVAVGDNDPSESTLSDPRLSVSTSSNGGSSHME